MAVSGLPVLYTVLAVRRMSTSLEHTVDRAGLRPSGAVVEAEEHDRHYRGAHPFGSGEPTFTVEQDTVRGGSMLHAFRRLVQARRALRPGRRRHEEDLGDVLFDIETYEGWASTFADHEIHMPDCFYMINKVLERLGTKAAPARAVLRLAKFANEVLAALFPAVQRGFGNAVLLIRT